MTTYAPYVQLHGLVISEIPRESGPAPTGGDRSIDSTSMSGLNYAVISDQGRNMRKYSFVVSSNSLEDIERVCEEANNAPEGAKFYWSGNGRFSRISKAQASFDRARPLLGVIQKYYANVDVFCSDPFQYEDPAQGIPFQFNATLPQSASLTNEGKTPAGLDFLQAQGDYSALGYTQGLAFSIAGKTLRLCDRLMRGDRFRVDGYGHILHEYETDFPMILSELQTDLHGPSFVNLDSGSIAYQNLTLAGNALLLMPFYGPRPISAYPELTVELTNVSGGAVPVVAYETDLSDLAEVEADDLHIGTNEIFIPDSIGQKFVAFGIRTTAAICVLQSIKGSVERYIAPSRMPKVDQNEAFTLTVYDDSNSNHSLKSLQADCRNIFWS